MGNLTVDIMPPAYWQDFEKLTLDLAKQKWGDDYAERNGRQGQAQAGVDVYGYNRNQSEHTGIQCKKRTWKTKPGADTPSNTLSTDEIDEEIRAASLFQPKLDRFILATSGPRDVELQTYVRDINRKPAKFQVALMFWDDYVELLNDHPELMYRYYENVLKFRDKYSPKEHYYLLISMAFDRPALRTPFHLENRATDFIEALSGTQNAISTGCLKDQDGRIIDQARVPAKKPKQLTNAAKKLQHAREIATKAIADGMIREHPAVIEILDNQIADDLNKLRFEAIELLNEVLRAEKMSEVQIDN
ncbi:MAG: hypothetical protein EOO53_14195 [Gammaproteobacteria bacterium]|nr:MAG: hypothetical protein EOO53_14195 [Gammaproteobacteria bacterium]